MTIFQNRSTKDEIETSIRTFQSVREGRTYLKALFKKLNEEVMKMGGTTYCVLCERSLIRTPKFIMIRKLK